jgi:hypothetical protein
MRPRIRDAFAACYARAEHEPAGVDLGPLGAFIWSTATLRT